MMTTDPDDKLSTEVKDWKLENERRHDVISNLCVGCAAKRQAKLHKGRFVHWYRDGNGYMPCAADVYRKSWTYGGLVT